MNNAVTYCPLNGMEIAIIGMVGRFPGAPDIAHYWQNLQDGVESITHFTKEELLAAGVDEILVDNPCYVRAGAILEDIDLFDARFFDYSAKEVEVMDPQQRIFLECAWEALEHAGYASEKIKEEIGVYAGVNLNTYFFNLLPGLEATESMENLHILTGNDKDYLTTRLAYKLNLKGPAVSVQTACSTSLVAVHLACRGLLSGDCDMALAGGVSIRVPQKSGYIYHEDGIYSPDGHCRAFDAQSKGTTFGSGVGIVVLKRLEDALAANDTIHAVIKGSAINNDGSSKIGYTAPSVIGQARVIRTALLSSEVAPESISYVETHGTGTPLGDPIEILALTEAFGTATKARCALGSVKTNIGHLDTAAGIAGLIKTILALQNKSLPGSLHFKQANPQINFAATPFYVNTALCEWKTNDLSRRAGVSSFGIGGTNAHVILEEAPPAPQENPSRDWQLLLLSAKTPEALDIATTHLATYFSQHDEISLANVAYTLQVGRRTFPYRRMIKCQSHEQAIEMLSQPENSQILSSFQPESDRPVVFLFPGQGSQYSSMACQLYQTEAEFRRQVDDCCQLLQTSLRLDLRSLLFPQADKAEEAAIAINRTEFAQPALFVIEYALAQLWISWGIKPQAFLGHSIGEYVAACLAGIFSLKDALSLVAARGKLIQQLPVGQMLGVAMSFPDLKKIVPADLDVAAVNAPSFCVVSGAKEKVQTFQTRLSADGIECRLLHTSHAFHSEMMEPILALFLEQVRHVVLKAPRTPFISNITGNWADASEVTNPNYWVRHLRQTVKFADGVKVLLESYNTVPLFLEVGPGHTLSTFVRQQLHETGRIDAPVVPSLPQPQAQDADLSVLIGALGQLWLAGVEIDWAGFCKKEQHRRIPLPTYPFERQRFWVGSSATRSAPEVRTKTSSSNSYISIEERTHFYLPSWKRSFPFSLAQNSDQKKRHSWLILKDATGFGDRMIQLVKRTELALDCIEVQPGVSFKKNNAFSYQINPQVLEDYVSLLRALKEADTFPHKIIHLWSLHKELVEDDAGKQRIEAAGFYSLLFLAQASGMLKVQDTLEVEVVANHFLRVSGEEILQPEKALMLGPCKVIPQEYPAIHCRAIDINLPSPQSRSEEVLLKHLLAEFTHTSEEKIIAYRGHDRWVQEFIATDFGQASLTNTRLRQNGVYLLTGGLGGVGLALAEYLARTQQARLVLLNRHPFPPREEWPALLAQNNDLVLKEKIQTLQHLESLGAKVLLVVADVTDYQEIEQAIKQTLAHFGALHGVIHAAGVPGGGLIQFRTPEQAAEVLRAKVTGTRHLAVALKGIDLDFFVLCSSTIALTGNIGQVDYSAANNFLDAFASYNTYKNDVFTLSINWDGWNRVGMNKEEHTLNASLLDYCLEKTETYAVYVTEYSTRKYWVLSEHQVMNKPTLPGTAYLQMVKEAFHDCIATQAVVIKDVLFLHPLWVDSDEVKEVYTILEKKASGFHFRILSRDATRVDRSQFQEHCRGTVCVATNNAEKSIDSKQIIANGSMQEISVEDVQKLTSASLVAWGPRWKNLQKVYVGKHEALACIELAAEFCFDLERMDLHPALLDLATGFACIVSGVDTYLPVIYKNICLQKPLPAKIFSYARQQENSLASKETLVFDITIFGESGNELVTIENFTLVNEDVLKATDATFNAESQREGSTQVEDRWLAGLLFQRAMRGLLPTRAIEAFEKLLSGVDISQVVVASSEQHNFDNQHSGAVAAPEKDIRPKAQIRPLRQNASPAYVAPRNKLEEDIASIWQEVLGEDQLGIHDNFFSLGGHSLLALQIVNQLRQTFDLDLPLSRLVQAPTIAEIAEFMSELLADKEEQEQAELLTLLGTLSDEEVEAELKKRGML